MPVQKIDPKVIFASNAPAIDKPPVFSDKAKGWDVARLNDGRPEIKQMNKVQQDTDLKILWLNENAVLPYDETIDYPEDAVTLKDGVLKQLKSGSWVDFIKPTTEIQADKVKDESGLTQQNINNGVDSIADLLNIPSPKNKNRAFVKSIQKWYTYTPSSTDVDNGVTVVGKWVMDLQDAYYASWFAQADTTIDQSLKLQTGYDYATKKGKPFIVDDIFYVDPDVVDGKKSAIYIRSNSCLIFQPNIGKIKLMPNDSSGYDIVRIEDVSNFAIFDLDIEGDRLTHTGTTGEWGYGLTVYQSKNGYIRNPKCVNMWGDGIYIGRNYYLNSSDMPENITIENAYVSGVRRNGISFTAGKGIKIIRPYVEKVGDYDGVTGTYPKSGIDIEPESNPSTPLMTITESIIDSATIKNCYAGIYVYMFFSNVYNNLTFTGRTLISGATNTCLGLFHGGSNSSGLIKFDDIQIESPVYTGISYAWNASSKLRCEIDNLYLPSDVSQFPAQYVLNGAFPEKKLGNINFKNIYAGCEFVLNPSINLSGYSDSSRFNIDETSPKKAFIYVGGGVPPTYAKDFYIGSYTLHTGYSEPSNLKNNTIWQDPSVAPTTDIYIQTNTDFRVLKIGLWNDSSNVGNGCRIMGLNLLIDGVVKTRMYTKTLGGWVKFQNVQGGRTIIYDSFGTWVFS